MTIPQDVSAIRDVPTGRGKPFASETSFQFHGENATGDELRERVRILDLNNRRPAVRQLKEWSLRQLAPRPGERAVDVGTGTGEDAVALSALVGPEGHTVGVEPSAGLREEARERAARAASPAVFEDGDARALPYPDASFDVVRCERVLQHLKDPETAVREMVRVLRPGGRVALIDTDWSMASLHPGDPDVVRRVLSALSAPLANPTAGRQLRGLLVAAGVELAATQAATWVDEGDAGSRGPVSAIPDRAVRAGAITPEEGHRLAGEISVASREGWFFRAVTLVAVVGRLPAARSTGNTGESTGT